jgi:hypothetical protein
VRALDWFASPKVLATLMAATLMLVGLEGVGGYVVLHHQAAQIKSTTAKTDKQRSDNLKLICDIIAANPGARLGSLSKSQLGRCIIRHRRADR